MPKKYNQSELLKKARIFKSLFYSAIVKASRGVTGLKISDILVYPDGKNKIVIIIEDSLSFFITEDGWLRKGFPDKSYPEKNDRIAPIGYLSDYKNWQGRNRIKTNGFNHRFCLEINDKIKKSFCKKTRKAVR